MPPHFSSSAGAPWDTVRSLSGDPWATVGKVAVKIRRRLNGDLAISIRWPHDASRVIEWRSADAYKGTPTWRPSCDSCAVTHEAPFDDPATATEDRARIRWLTPWTPHSCINRAGLTWRSSQDAHTSRWILLSQFIVQTDWFITMAKERNRRARVAKHVKQRVEKSPRWPGLVKLMDHLQVKSQVKTVGMKTQRPRNSQSRSQIDRISRSQPSSANTRVFTTCPILTTRTRRREISWSSSSPSPCSVQSTARAVCVFFHSTIILKW